MRHHIAISAGLVLLGVVALYPLVPAVRSLRVGCGMISRGEVGLIVTAMGASTGIFGRSEVAVMVAVVLLTTILTPLVLRGAFHLASPQDVAEGLTRVAPAQTDVLRQGISFPATAGPESVDGPPDRPALRVRTPGETEPVSIGSEAISNLE